MDLALPAGPAMRPWSVETRLQASLTPLRHRSNWSDISRNGTRPPAGGGRGEMSERCGESCKAQKLLRPQPKAWGPLGFPPLRAKAQINKLHQCNDLLKGGRQAPRWQPGRNSLPSHATPHHRGKNTGKGGCTEGRPCLYLLSKPLGP